MGARAHLLFPNNSQLDCSHAWRGAEMGRRLSDSDQVLADIQHGLPDNIPFEMPNTGGVTVTPLEANHCE
jgi:hypothetical protein